MWALVPHYSQIPLDHLVPKHPFTIRSPASQSWELVSDSSTSFIIPRHHWNPDITPPFVPLYHYPVNWCPIHPIPSSHCSQTPMVPRHHWFPLYHCSVNWCPVHPLSSVHCSQTPKVPSSLFADTHGTQASLVSRHHSTTTGSHRITVLWTGVQFIHFLQFTVHRHPRYPVHSLQTPMVPRHHWFPDIIPQLLVPTISLFCELVSNSSTSISSLFTDTTGTQTSLYNYWFPPYHCPVNWCPIHPLLSVHCSQTPLVPRHHSTTAGSHCITVLWTGVQFIHFFQFTVHRHHWYPDITPQLLVLNVSLFCELVSNSSTSFSSLFADTTGTQTSLYNYWFPPYHCPVNWCPTHPLLSVHFADTHGTQALLVPRHHSKAIGSHCNTVLRIGVHFIHFFQFTVCRHHWYPDITPQPLVPLYHCPGNRCLIRLLPPTGLRGQTLKHQAVGN